MKTLIHGEKRIICSNPDSPFRYFGWPTVARLSDGSLAMVCSGFRLKHICPFGKMVICYSRDDGQTWTRPAPVIDTPLDDRDGGITPFGNGRVIVTSFNNRISRQRTWNEKTADPLINAYLDLAEQLGNEKEFLGSTYKLSDDGGYTFGELRHSPITAPHGPCRLNDGSLLYVGRRFDADDRFDDGSTPYIEVMRLNRNDEFEHLSYIENIPAADREGFLLSCEPHAVQLESGRIVVHIRVQDRRNLFTTFQSVSDDGGHTFTKPVQLLERLGGAPAHLLRHSSGTLISAYGYREAPYGIRVMLSRDEGESWDTDNVLYDGGYSNDLGYPSSTELPDGRILTVFYENTGNGSVISQLIWKLPE